MISSLFVGISKICCTMSGSFTQKHTNGMVDYEGIQGLIKYEFLI